MTIKVGPEAKAVSPGLFGMTDFSCGLSSGPRSFQAVAQKLLWPLWQFHTMQSVEACSHAPLSVERMMTSLSAHCKSNSRSAWHIPHAVRRYGHYGYQRKNAPDHVLQHVQQREKAAQCQTSLLDESERK